MTVCVCLMIRYILFLYTNAKINCIWTQIPGSKGRIGDGGFKGELGDRGFPGDKGKHEGETL